jgi:hypothetical protein
MLQMDGKIKFWNVYILMDMCTHTHKQHLGNIMVNKKDILEFKLFISIFEIMFFTKSQDWLLFKEFDKNSNNHIVYFMKVQGNSFVIIPLYVNNIILNFNNLFLLKEIKDNLSKKFEILNITKISILP